MKVKIHKMESNAHGTEYNKITKQVSATGKSSSNLRSSKSMQSKQKISQNVLQKARRMTKETTEDYMSHHEDKGRKRSETAKDRDGDIASKTKEQIRRKSSVTSL